MIELRRIHDEINASLLDEIESSGSCTTGSSFDGKPTLKVKQVCDGRDGPQDLDAGTRDFKGPPRGG
jgi:hypothetical protein